MKKKIFIIILFILILFVVGLSIYKFKFYNSTKYYFIGTNISEKRDSSNKSILDKDTYSEKIINEHLLKLNYEFYDKDESITGQIYIATDNYLYITESNNDIKKRLSIVKFKTMYKKDYQYTDGIYVYLISDNNKLYYLELNSNNVLEAEVKQVKMPFDVTNFVDLDFKNDMYKSGNTLFVLSKDGNIYDVASEIRYDENIISLYNNLYIFNDNTISDVYGRMLHDNDGNNYKIKYVFMTYEDNKFTEKNTILIITEDDKVIFIDNDSDVVYEFNKKITNIEFNVKYPYVKDKLIIEFEDEYRAELTASCNQYFCPNEFAE